MTEPKKYLNKLSLSQLTNMLLPTKRHLVWEHKLQDQTYTPFWDNLLHLIQYKIDKKEEKQREALN